MKKTRRRFPCLLGCWTRNARQFSCEHRRCNGLTDATLSSWKYFGPDARDNVEIVLRKLLDFVTRKLPSVVSGHRVGLHRQDRLVDRLSVRIDITKTGR